MRIKYELILWFNGFLKIIPGNIGCTLRNVFLPYKCGQNVKVWDLVHIDSPSKLNIGNNVSINRGTIINAGGNVTLGNDVLIGPNVIIYSQNHKFDRKEVPIRLQGYDRNPVLIGDNVWIASNVTILPGVSIADNVVVGANSLVSKSIDHSGVYGGSPLKLLKKF
ncbi:acyltransferase [Sediminibacter sp. Hel_I_10]|uniref:acyltransferase n=1 Tax=Sediminibacter sp. Hel_I_10 TaxID=1392490 RepID=UPI000560316C|nr:acyltransferase [Sediminibacter sp. Hel_I_10]